MTTAKPEMEIQNKLLEKTCAEFLRAARLIENLDDEIYTAASESSGSLGAHFRHNIDFAENFLKGLRTRKIDYAARERDPQIEQNRQYAVERLEFLIKTLRSLPREFLETKVSARSEVDENLWHDSSAARELEFLYSHTVHHHAIIAEKLKTLGIKLFADFGVAPSTLKFWAEREKSDQSRLPVLNGSQL